MSLIHDIVQVLDTGDLWNVFISLHDMYNARCPSTLWFGGIGVCCWTYDQEVRGFTPGSLTINQVATARMGDCIVR